MGSGLPAHIEEADLVSYGLLGLIGALERFDPSRNIKFETYAISRIRGRSSMSCGRSTGSPDLSAVGPARWRRTVTEAREPTASGAHRRGDRKRARRHRPEFQDILHQISSASIVALDEFWTALRSTATRSPDRHHRGFLLSRSCACLDSQAVKEILADAIHRLPEREKIVIGLYYYEGLTLKEIGEVLGVTESRVSQLHTKAILRLAAHQGRAGAWSPSRLGPLHAAARVAPLHRRSTCVLHCVG